MSRIIIKSIATAMFVKITNCEIEHHIWLNMLNVTCEHNFPLTECYYIGNVTCLWSANDRSWYCCIHDDMWYYHVSSCISKIFVKTFKIGYLNLISDFLSTPSPDGSVGRKKTTYIQQSDPINYLVIKLRIYVCFAIFWFKSALNQPHIPMSFPKVGLLFHIIFHFSS